MKFYSHKVSVLKSKNRLLTGTYQWLQVPFSTQNTFECNFRHDLLLKKRPQDMVPGTATWGQAVSAQPSSTTVNSWAMLPPAAADRVLWKQPAETCSTGHCTATSCTPAAHFKSEQRATDIWIPIRWILVINPCLLILLEDKIVSV